MDGLPLPTTLAGWLYTSLVPIVTAIITYVITSRRIPSEISLNLAQAEKSKAEAHKSEAEARKTDANGTVSLMDTFEEAAINAVERWKVAIKEIEMLEKRVSDLRRELAESQRAGEIATAQVKILEKEIVQLNCQAKLKP